MNSRDRVAQTWIWRSAGAATVAAFALFVLTTFDGGLEGFVMVVVGSLGVGFAVGLFGQLCYLIVSGAVEAASEHKNPFLQGAAFFIFVLIFAAISDLLLLRGTFVVEPIVTLILTGNVGDSYWGCQENWVDREEGSYCDR